MLPLLLALAAAQVTIPTLSSKLSESDLRLANYKYGTCVVHSRERRAVQALLNNIDDAGLLKRYEDLFVPSCWPVQQGTAMWVSLHADRVRYAIADALFRKQLADKPPPTLASVPALEHWDPGPSPALAIAAGNPPTGRKYGEKLRTYMERAAFSQFSKLGECIVRTDSAATKVLLVTVPNSADEGAAFVAVKPALADCLPVGHTLSLTRLPLRGTIAVNYYRLANAAARVAK